MGGASHASTTPIKPSVSYRIRKVDQNQARIVAALRQIGVKVISLHTIGHGCPDLLCGYRGKNKLLEVKRDGKAKLTPDQEAFAASWRGSLTVVCSPEEAIAAILGY